MKNLILKTVTWINVVLFLLFACCIDSEGTYVPAIGCLITGAWLALFAYANRDYDFED